MKSLKIIVVTAFLSALGAGLTYAHQPDMSDEREAYITRDGLMHLMSSQRYVLIEMLVGKAPVDQAEFVRAANALAAMSSMIPVAFEKNLMVYESRAKPEIWQNWDDFVTVADNLGKVAAEIATMAEIHGAEAVIEKVREIDCGSCHGPYRN